MASRIEPRAQPVVLIALKPFGRERGEPNMRGSKTMRWSWLLGAGIVCGLLVAPQMKASSESEDRVSIQIVVTDAETGQPVSQAHLTLQFSEPGNKYKLKRSHAMAYSAKTNPQGRCKFVDIPKGAIRLMVTADRHASFGKDFEIEKDGQVVEVKLKKPQPQL
jgi:hypothetical protein